MNKKTAVVITLGCRLNQADTALLCERLERLGFEIVSQDSHSNPDLIIVNSCSVTGTAFKKSKQALRGIRAENPQAFIVFTGCSADVDAKELEGCNEYNIILTNEQKKDIGNILPRHLAYLEIKDSKKDNSTTENPISDTAFNEYADGVFPFKTRAILKIQEGCENFCSYCIVPYARGRERSRNFAETVKSFRSFVKAGYQEIVLSGVNTCHYSSNDRTLIDLLDELLTIDGNFRIRLSSTEPGPILPALVDKMKESENRICQFLHLPLQHGSDTILKSMNRHYLTSEYAEFVKYARQQLPEIHIGSDLIVGFPNETNELFEESFDFIHSINLANLHVFPFSPRKGTPAAEMPYNITQKELKERITKLKELKKEMSINYASSLINTTDSVLIETKRKNNTCEGWSGNYMKTRIKSTTTQTGTLLNIKFKKLTPDGILEAEII